jgi:cytidyltransferase-like protein
MHHRVVLVTGGFDPLHSGHIKYLKAAKDLGSFLIVGLNSDEWLTRKKGRAFLSWEERACILQELKFVDKVINFNDDDDTACDAIYKCITQYSNSRIIFANGGDRSSTTTPEFKTYGNTPWVRFEFGVGGDNKANSSSWILDNWRTKKTERPWGYWRVLDNKQPELGVKVKELVINPGSSLSNQRHKHRSEHWYVLKGTIQIELTYPDGRWSIQMLSENTSFVIPVNVWHKTTNIGDIPASIIEIQYGDMCVEEDIERL